MNNLRINGTRLWDSLMELAQIGATPKSGVKRLALTDLDRQGRDLVTGWAKEAGLAITIDQIGNVFMRREGTNPALAPIVTGSHIDTQPTGVLCTAIALADRAGRGRRRMLRQHMVPLPLPRRRRQRQSRLAPQ